MSTYRLGVSNALPVGHVLEPHPETEYVCVMAGYEHLRGDWCPEAGRTSGGTRSDRVCSTCGAPIQHRDERDNSPVERHPIPQRKYGPRAPARPNTARRDQRIAIGIVVAILLVMLCFAIHPALGFVVLVGLPIGVLLWAD